MGVIICRDKSKFDLEEAKSQIAGWNHKLKKHPGREWAYEQIAKPLIVIEEYLKNPESDTESPNDYKLMCFDGKVMMFWVEPERTIGLKRNFFDENCNPIDIFMGYDQNPNYTLPSKEVIDELFAFAESSLFHSLIYVLICIIQTNLSLESSPSTQTVDISNSSLTRKTHG